MDADTYTVAVTIPADVAGNVSLGVPAGAASDLAGNGSLAGAAAGLVVDRIAPTVSVAADGAAIETGDDAVFTVTFSESVSGYDAADMTVTSTSSTP